MKFAEQKYDFRMMMRRETQGCGSVNAVEVNSKTGRRTGKPTSSLALASALPRDTESATGVSKTATVSTSWQVGSWHKQQAVNSNNSNFIIFTTAMPKMKKTYQVRWKGKTYVWKDGTETWWDSHGKAIEYDVASKLTERFMAEEATKHVEGTSDDDDRLDLFDDFSRMGATERELIDVGGWYYVFREDPDFAAEQIVDTLPPASRSFLNCPLLRDEYFNVAAECYFSYPVAIVGQSPFDRVDFTHFLTDHRISVCELGRGTKVIILGREGWSEFDINTIINSASGLFLRIYSQEMFLSVLAGQPDPFEIRSMRHRTLCLNAFRVGHPGLEYVSQGWAGWVRADLTTRGKLPKSAKADEIDRVASSPIYKMGYRVGRQGLTPSARRKLLSDAFTGDLPFVQSASYMKEWGRSGSGKRLRKLARLLAANIHNANNRSGADSYQEAIEDWRDDLEWLKTKYYSGVHHFDWPRAKIHR
ncbi:hypothetical protein Mal15_42350 [Stieleria maiorica]|uniref:Uncharacterized protein n=1 Tax=Stieleria maiorica TaxID=2795974 RepID=A0A5B9MKN7_9BACT|nr:hypothetical protein [Stieleria maiorica]QEG00166.1 hypothetical protein Mal15_42350 [Stieleria maiorica]